MPKPRLHDLLPQPETPAQAMYNLVRTTGWCTNKSSFARLAQIDVGNVYNYLADAGKRNRIHATTETLRKWASRLTEQTRLGVTVSEDAAGDVIVSVRGTSPDGQPIPPACRTCPAIAVTNHRCGHPDSRSACDDLIAALRAFLGEGATCEHLHTACVVRVGEVELRIRHERDLPSVDVDVKLGTGKAGKVDCAGLPTGAAVLLVADAAGLLRPDEAGTHWEGERRQIRLSRYERDPEARRACLAHHTAQCSVCELRFGDVYGPLGEGFIHVHHLRPLASVGEGHVVDPINDLAPVCPNCHAMFHRDRRYVPTIAEMRALIARFRRGPTPPPPPRRGGGRPRAR